MAPHCFNELSIHNQLHLVMNKGIRLGVAKRYNLNLYLFSLDGMFVEMICRQDSEKLITIRVIDDEESLEPYIEAIDLSEVLA